MFVGWTCGFGLAENKVAAQQSWTIIEERDSFCCALSEANLTIPLRVSFLPFVYSIHCLFLTHWQLMDSSGFKVFCMQVWPSGCRPTICDNLSFYPSKQKRLDVLSHEILSAISSPVLWQIFMHQFLVLLSTMFMEMDFFAGAILTFGSKPLIKVFIVAQYDLI